MHLARCARAGQAILCGFLLAFPPFPTPGPPCPTPAPVPPTTSLFVPNVCVGMPFLAGDGAGVPPRPHSAHHPCGLCTVAPRRVTVCHHDASMRGGGGGCPRARVPPPPCVVWGRGCQHARQEPARRTAPVCAPHGAGPTSVWVVRGAGWCLCKFGVQRGRGVGPGSRCWGVGSSSSRGPGPGLQMAVCAFGTVTPGAY